jgi:hypothetical protein
MARQRHVFPTNEIPHLWAHKVQGDARNPQGNFYFKGDTIYSYRDSYPIASHIASGKKSAVLIRAGQPYSVTTSGHISAVRSSIPRDVTVFEVPSVQTTWTWSPEGPDHETNLKYFVAESRDRLHKAERSRKWGLSELEAAFEYKETAARYAKFLRLPSPLKSFSFLPNGCALTELKQKLSERKERASVLDAEKRAREEARWAERRRIDALDAEERNELWRSGNPHARPAWNAPTMLRIRGYEVETSRGARVPIEHAVRTLRVVRCVVNRGQEFIPNGHSLHVGHYRVDRIEVNGTVHAGCHVITLQEIERIAPVLEATEQTDLYTGGNDALDLSRRCR